MPLLTNVIDDKSPLIAYDATWLAGTAQDVFATDYYLGTFTVNNVTNGLATFDFNGTAVWIYGANRPNHGSYTVQVDSATYSGFNGAGNNLFQQPIFNISSLNQGMHTVKLTNTASGGLYVDIDMIVWQSQVGNPDDQLVAEIVQDTDSRFQYQEPAWSTSSSALNFGLFNNGTGHVTQTYEASVTFGFTGMPIVQCEAISLYGTSGPSNGPYSAQLDGGQTVQYNASNTYPNYYGVMLYNADNLGPGLHELVLTNLPAISGQSLSIDYAQLWTTSNTSSTSTLPPNPSSGDISPNELSSGAIAGIVISVVAAVLSAGTAFFFYQRWKAAMAAQHDLYRAYVTQQRLPVSTASTAPPTGFSSSLETRTNTDPTQAFSWGDSSYTAQYNGASSSGSRTGISDPPSSQTQSAVDEALEQRLLRDARGGVEPSNLTDLQRRQSVTTLGRSSVAVSEVPPPNYTQATRHVGTTRI